MQVIVVGTGKLAAELLSSLKVGNESQVVGWADRSHKADRSIVVHAGSGKELAAVASYCEATRSPLVELATGSELGSEVDTFPLVLCPNTNILMLKVMSMLEKSGHLFHPHAVQLTESHQSSKTSVPGTAVSLARSLGLQDGDILSVREPTVQRTELKIPDEHLARHAYHQIVLADGECSVTIETRVYGESPYANGVGRIVAAVQARDLANRCYSIVEFVNNGWL